MSNQACPPQSLDEFFRHFQKLGEPLVLATIVETIGSTYRKAGAHMLIARDGQAAGLLSGGCAESDLIERARQVFAGGAAQLATYDTRGSDDVIWGIGLGCEGAMRILLTLLDGQHDYQPFNYILECQRLHRRGSVGFALAGNHAVGSCYRLDDTHGELHERLQVVAQSGQSASYRDAAQNVFMAPVELPPRLLVLGAGADALPLVELAALLGWQTVVADHRPAYAVAERFAAARQVLCVPAAELPSRAELNEFDAAVVMSHHLPTDATYLGLLASSTVRYVGLLGPAKRRERLMSEIGACAALLAGRLAGPVGLDIGAHTPQAIALAMVAEIHAHLHGKSGGSFSGLLNQVQRHSTNNA
jgi:xanthine dehydrogenase accessory factor